MKAILVVIDGFGIGELPDAKLYKDEGSNTFKNINVISEFVIPTFEKLGLKNIDGVNLFSTANVVGNYAKLQEKSAGKDTLTGHLEMMGIITKNAFKTYPKGFEKDIINQIEKITNRKVIGNKVASGTEIIKELGEQQQKDGSLIVYTSADSVLQIATHIDTISLNELYSICEKVRKIMVGKNSVARIIARPFAGKTGEFYRTKDRKDFPLIIKDKTTLEILKENNIDVFAIGKINEIFSGKGICKHFEAKTNFECFEQLSNLIKGNDKGLIFVNFEDTDMLYGHRNDVVGYRQEIEHIDAYLRSTMQSMKKDDILLVCADHGNDPTTVSTDHSREFVPLLIYGKSLKENQNMGTLLGFDNISKILFDFFGIKNNCSVLKELKKWMK